MRPVAHRGSDCGPGEARRYGILAVVVVNLLLAGCTEPGDPGTTSAIAVIEDDQTIGAVNLTDLRETPARGELQQILDHASTSPNGRWIARVHDSGAVLDLFVEVSATPPYRVLWNGTCYNVLEVQHVAQD